MEQWLEGVLRTPRLRPREKLALVELYPDADESVVSDVLREFGDRPDVVRLVRGLPGRDHAEVVVMMLPT